MLMPMRGQHANTNTKTSTKTDTNAVTDANANAELCCILFWLKASVQSHCRAKCGGASVVGRAADEGRG